MDSNPNKQSDHLGINKISKSIKKSPLHQPNFPIPNPNQPQPQVYNVNKNDFRNIVQQLTGSPLREPLPRPTQNHPKPPNNRLQRVRPPPLAPTGRPRVPIYPQAPVASQPRPLNNVPYSNNMARPPHPSQFDHLSPNMPFPPTPNDVWSNTSESPVSAYVRYLQNSIMDSAPRQGQPQNMPQPQVQPPYHVPNLPPPQAQPPPYPVQNVPQPRVRPHYPIQNVPQPQPPQGQPGLVPNHGGPPMQGPPRVNGPYYMPPPSPRGANLASPRAGGSIPPPLLSPTSQFLLPSPTGFGNLLSPRSPYPLLSPGYQNPPPPRSPNFSFNSIGQSGNFGPGLNQLPPPSPGYGVPLSPSGFFPLLSPGWRG